MIHFNSTTREQTPIHRQWECQTELFTRFNFSGESRHPISVIRNSLEHGYVPTHSGKTTSPEKDFKYKKRGKPHPLQQHAEQRASPSPPPAAGTSVGRSPRPVTNCSSEHVGSRDDPRESPAPRMAQQLGALVLERGWLAGPSTSPGLCICSASPPPTPRTTGAAHLPASHPRWFTPGNKSPCSLGEKEESPQRKIPTSPQRGGGQRPPRERRG